MTLPNGMNEFQRQVFDYLTVPGYPERIEALAFLCRDRLFDNLTEDEAREKLAKRLDAWQTGSVFCAEGIERARKALFPPARRKLKVTVEIDVEGTGDLSIDPGMYSPDRHGMTADAITRALRGLVVDRVPVGERKIVRAYVTSMTG